MDLKYLTFFAFLFVLLFNKASFSQPIDTLSYLKVKELADSLRKVHAPDRRTALFDLNQDSSGTFLLESTEHGAVTTFLAEMKRKAIDPVLTVNILPDQSLKDTLFGLVNVSVANIRSKPSNSAEMATQALLGSQLDLLKKENGYFLVRTPDGYISYLDHSAVSVKTPDQLKDWTEAPKVIITSDYGHIYSEPDKRSLRVSDVVMGNTLRLNAVKGSFFEVVFPDGRKGFVEKSLATDYSTWLDTRQLVADSVLTIAKTMMGVPYLWGGTSVKGVDCSGFTKTAFFMNGIVIQRDASQQVLAGKEINILSSDTLDTQKALANLEPADLLFFASGKGRLPDARVTHVALYLGEGQFIHSAGKVRINSMVREADDYADFESRTIIAARRYIGELDGQHIKKINLD